MEIEWWMLALYMVCGICFFVFLSVKITPRFAKRAILNGLKGPEGKEIMREIVMSALSTLNEPMEIQGPADEEGKPTVVKTTLGAIVMGEVAKAVVYHFKMTFLGEKGRLSKELKGAGMDFALAQLPPNLQPLMASIQPLLSKHPVLGAVMAIGMQMMQQNQQQGQQAARNVPLYG